MGNPLATPTSELLDGTQSVELLTGTAGTKEKKDIKSVLVLTITISTMFITIDICYFLPCFHHFFTSQVRTFLRCTLMAEISN